MSEPSQTRPEVMPATGSQAAPRSTGRAVWFGWYIALCLVLLAAGARRQLALQQSLLDGSRELETVVAQSRVVAADTNTQLQRVAELDSATRAMNDKLARLGAVNAAIKREMVGLEQTAGQIDQVVGKLGEAAGRSQQVLLRIAEQSRQLDAAMQEARRIGADVTGSLQLLVRLQQGVNADLAEIVRKTAFLAGKGGGR